MTRRSRRRLPDEFELIARYFAPLATAHSSFRLMDDVALVRRSSGRELIVKVDATIEGVHFLKSDPPKMIAQKALRRALSDIAAKGGVPSGYLMALALPPWVSPDWMRAFAGGFKSDQIRFGISLLGGDTARTSGPLSIAITLLGEIPPKALIKRSGAEAGQLIFVSGTIGDAGLGLELLLRGKRRPVGPLERYRLPQPRLKLGAALRGLATAAIDLSDGLVADIGHIAESSGVSCVAFETLLPLSSFVREAWGTRDRKSVV